MMTAEQARNFSRIYKKQITESQLKYIYKLIKKALKGGQDEIKLCGIVLTKETKNTLINLGYKVRVGYDYIISWGEEKDG